MLLAGVIRGIGYLVSKKISREKGSAQAMALGNALVDTLISLPILLYFLVKPQGIQLYWGLIILAVISAAAYGMSVAFQYAALKRIDISVMSIVLRLTILFSALMGIVFLGERLNIWNYLGLLIILIGNLIILWKGRKFALSAGIIFTLGSAFVAAVASNLDKFILTKINSVFYVFLNSLLIAITLFISKPKAIRESIQLIRKSFGVFLLMSLLTISAWLLGSYVLQNMDVSRFIPIQKTITLIIPVLFGITFFKEKQHWQQKLLGLTLAIVGIVMMYL